MSADRLALAGRQRRGPTPPPVSRHNRVRRANQTETASTHVDALFRSRLELGVTLGSFRVLSTF